MMSTGVCRWLFLLISLSTWTTFTSSKEMRVVCYYTNWSVYRPGAAKFSPQNINPYLCTHLIYAFGGFTKENTLKPFDKYQDIEKGGYAKFTGLKTYNKNLKTMLAIGGWNEGSSRFSSMVASSERRKELVRNTVKFLRQNHFDGLDLDWEYPTFRDGGKHRDRDNYAQLVEELREEFDRESSKTGRPRLLLTMAVPAGIEYINKGYDVPRLTKYLDWMNILSYDYHSAFEPAVNHHAPLYSLEEDNEYNYDAELNIDFTVKHYLKLGADPHKLVLGIPTYGRSYTLYNQEANEIGSPADGPGEMGEATRENGYLAYYEICEYVKNQNWDVEQPNPSAMGPYAYKENQWVGYDDESIVRKKSEYVAENELGGIMFWAIDNDDFRGNCHGKPYPLIEAGKEALLNAYGITDNNLISPPTKTKSRTRTRSKAAGKKADEESNVEKVSNSGGSNRRNRFKSKAKEQDRESASTRQKPRRKELRTTTEAFTTHSSLKVVTPSYTTPAPPSTPDLDGAFKCEDEGFFPHPKDCKKYFWCLSGAGDSGIVAHQFTCPAGLYFNKAADSCDYTRNVLCNKKLHKATTITAAPSASTSTSTTTPATAVFSTSKAPPKITAATSRTTYKISTTTEPYDDEYEYEDDDEEEDEEDKSKNDPEEDPRVIKELIDLIKKAGGIEELEKQLSNSKTDVISSSSPDSTTPSAISKSLYERVLNKAVKNNLNSRKNPLSALSNSRGPQNDGLSRRDETSSSNSKTDRGKLQYTSISRNRPSTEKSVEDEKDTDGEVNEDNVKTRRTYSKKFQPEYVTIRRPKITTTTEASEASESDSSLSRNKILGETSDEEYDDDDDDDEDDVVKEEDESNKKVHTPQYSTIRRQRPSATEESTTSKYTVLRRGSTSTTESTSETDEGNTTSKYKILRRGSTTSPSTTTESDNSSKYQLRRGTTQPATTTPSATSDGATSRFKNFRRGSTTAKPTQEVEIITTLNSNESSVTTPIDDENDVTPRSSTIKRNSTDAPELNTSQYQVLIRGSTTTEPEADTAATISARATTRLPTNSEIGSTTPSNDEEKITTLANVIDDTTTAQISSTVKTNSSKELLESQKPEDVTTTIEKTASSTPTDVTDNETGTSQKAHPQLFDPRPFSVFSRGSTSTVKPVTESTIQNSKVSQSNFKFRLRPKTSDVSSVQGTTTSENPISKSNSRLRSRGGSRFSSNNQNVNDFNGNEENIEEDTNSKFKLRKRILATEKYVDENRTYRPSEIADLSSLTAVDFSRVKELNSGRGIHRRRGRPYIASTIPNTEENSAEQIADESLKTDSRALPLSKKVTETSTLESSRNIVRSKTDQFNSTSEINVKSKRIRGRTRTTRQPSTTENSDITSKNSENIASEIVSITPRSRRVVRRFRTTTSKSVPNKTENLAGRSLDQIQTFKRRSFVTEKQNQSEINDLTASLNGDRQNPLQRLFSKKPTRLPFVIQKNDVEEDNDDSAEDSSTEEGENIKLSESNIRENSDVNSYNVEGKQNRRLFKVRPKSDIFHGKTNSDKENIETEKIETVSIPKLESKTEKNNNFSTNTREEDTNYKIADTEIFSENSSEIAPIEVSSEINDKANVEITKDDATITVKVDKNIKTSTQPSVARTRKRVIRKFKHTTTTERTTTLNRTTTTESTIGRKRKIIRKFRPTTINKDLETSNSDVSNQTQQDQSSTRDRIITSLDVNNKTEKELTRHIFRPSITRPKSKYIKADLETTTTTEATEEIKTPVRIALRKLPSRNTYRTRQKIEENKNITDAVKTEVGSTKHIFNPKLSELRNKYKSLVGNQSNIFVSSTDKNVNIIESAVGTLTNNSEEKTLKENVHNEKLENTTVRSEENVSTMGSIQEDSVLKELLKPGLNLPTSNSGNGNVEDDKIISEDLDTSTESTNISNNSVTIKIANNDTEEYPSQRYILNTTTEENLTDVTDKLILSSDVTESYNEFTELPSNINVTVNTENKFEVDSSTTVYNLETSAPSTSEDNERDGDDDEEDTTDESEGDRNRKYIAVFRSSSTSNSFKDFDSEVEGETPRFEDLFEDKDIHKDLYEHDIKFDDHTEYGTTRHYDDDDDDYYKYDDDRLIGDTSTEFRSTFSYSPNDLDKEDKTYLQPVEASSQRNHFYRPYRPSFIRPKITFSTTEKQVPQRPKYKTFSRTSTKTLRKETIQIHSFNNTDEDGNPEKAVNKVLFKNSIKYNTLERTTSSPEMINLSVNESNISSDEAILSENSTPLYITTSEENIVTTQSSEDENITENSNLDVTFNEETTVAYKNLGIGITTQINIDNIDSELKSTTEINENPTMEAEISTVTDNSLLQTETVFTTSEPSETESVNISEKNQESDFNRSTSSENPLEIISTTTEIPSTTSSILFTETDSEYLTTVIPETTTPYRRRSTLKPINSRPKFTPVKRKNTYGSSSTTEKNGEGVKQKNKFYRNRYQKSTTESVTDYADNSGLSHSNQISSTILPTNKVLYSYSTTRKPTPIEKEFDIPLTDEEEESEGVNSQYPEKGNSEFIEQINNVFRSTTAVPVNEYVLTHSTTETNRVGDEGSDIEVNKKEDIEVDDKITKSDETNEEHDEEYVDDKVVLNTSSETSIVNYSSRPQLSRPKSFRVSNAPTNKRRPNIPIRNNSPLFTGRSTTVRVVNRPVFGKTTEAPKVSDDLSGIDTEAVRNRNKNLFSKQRKINSPVNAESVSSVEELNRETTTNVANSLEVTTSSQDYITLASLVTESTTKANVPETTEYLTTLHHVFAEVKDSEINNNNVETTTDSLSSLVTSTTGKIERLIEVNRIVQVQTKEDKVKNHFIGEQSTAEVVEPVLDKIGEINRVTVIKVVDGNDTVIENINSQENEIKRQDPISPVYNPEPATTEKPDGPLPDLPLIEVPARVEEVPAPNILGNINVTNITVTIDEMPNILQSPREGRKFESDSNNNNQIVSEKKAEIIEGISHINIITPRPTFVEDSTIALEGLFQTESAHPTSNSKQLYPALHDELLEAEHSKFVNVRVLHPDENFGSAVRDNSKLLPIKLLNQDQEEITLKAEVVEIKPKTSLDSIKIVPIRVEMSRRISDNLPVLRVTPQDTYTG